MDFTGNWSGPASDVADFSSMETNIPGRSVASKSAVPAPCVECDISTDLIKLAWTELDQPARLPLQAVKTPSLYAWSWKALCTPHDFLGSDKDTDDTETITVYTTMPFDVVKTRTQSARARQYGSSAPPSMWPAQKASHHYGQIPDQG